MNPYQPGEDNQDPYEVGYKAGAASRAEQIASLKDELRQISTAIDDVRLDLTNTSAELIMEMKERLASRDAEVVSLTNQRDYEYVRAENAEQERDQLREQVALLREEVTRCRDWFEAQAKVKSKGSPSSWEFMLLRDERDAADEALAATEPKP